MATVAMEHDDPVRGRRRTRKLSILIYISKAAAEGVRSLEIFPV